MKSRLRTAFVIEDVRRAGWAVADQGISPVVQLAITPFLLARLGHAAFGVWVLAITLINMSQLISCGAAVATTKHVSADLAIGAKIDAVGAIRAALTIATVGGALAVVIAWLGAPLVSRLFFSQMGSVEELAPILALCGVAAAIQEIDSVFVGAMRGAERFDLCAKTEIPCRVALGGVLVYIASIEPNVHTLIVGLIAVSVFKAALKARQLCLLLQSADCCIPGTATEPLRRVFRFGAWQWLQSAGAALFATTDQLMIGGLLGASELSRYSICQQIAQNVHYLPSVILQIIFPKISAIGVQIDADRGNRYLMFATTLALFFAVALGVPIILLARPIMALWINAPFAQENYVLLIILVGVHMILAFNIGAYYVLLGRGKSEKSAQIVLLAGVAQSAVAFIAAPFGVLAMAANRSIYALITAFLYPLAKFPKND